MAVDANTYGTVAGVQRLIGDIVDSRTFSGSTVPTLTQAEAELDAVAMEINAYLDTFGYTVPVVDADWPTAYGYLKAANEYGAAARLLGTIPSHAFDPDEDIVEVGQTRAQMYESYLSRLLKKIEKRQLRAAMWKYPLNTVYSGSRLDSDGNVKLPLFTRTRDEYPGIRTLTED
jgi:hypothetical protein